MATLETLYDALADIERQQQDQTLSHSDQQLLDQAWEEISNQIDELDGVEAECHTCKKTMTEDDMESWACDDDAVDWRRPQCDGCRAVPAEPVRFAPPPPSVTLETGINRRGELVTRLPDGRWVPAPPLPATWRPPPIEIPVWTGSPSMPPPPPRPVAICNCDSDGQCGYCEEERWNSLDDTRTGCERCSGCHYCQDGGRYDGADEV
jgi:hypothetical protein